MHIRSCVKCGQELTPQRVVGVEIDHCPGCGGLWLDRQELQQLAANPELALEELHDLASQNSSGENAPYRSASPPQVNDRDRLNVPCPACAGKMTSAEVGSVNIELCNACGGVFLDAGELKQATAEFRERNGFGLASIAALARSVSTSGTIGD